MAQLTQPEKVLSVPVRALTRRRATITIATKRVDAYTITAVIKKAGKEIRTVVNAVTKDGKVTTQTAKGTNEQGQPMSYTAVWDRQ